MHVSADELTAKELELVFRSVAEDAVANGASDIHLRAGREPIIRRQGALRVLTQHPVFTQQMLKDLVEEVLLNKEKRPKIGRILADHGEADFSYSMEGVARFRANVYMQRGRYGIVLRIVPEKVPAISSLNLPNIVEKLAMEPRGLVLITGAAGNGKSTTMAAIVEHINTQDSRHIITIEDPIEFYFQDKKSIIDQRELYVDTQDVNNALAKALRQDPDVIVIGEMRDPETVRVALAAAETGHLVLSTLHTIGAEETFDRILDFFSEHEQGHARLMLASSLRAIVSQRLLPARQHKNQLIPATEVLIVNQSVREEIISGASGASLNDIIEKGEYYQMHSFDQSLLKLVREGKVTMEAAKAVSSKPEDFRIKLDAENLTNKYSDVIKKDGRI